MKSAQQVLEETAEFDTPEFDPGEVSTTMELHSLSEDAWDNLPYGEQAALIDAAHQR
jgi:hypothetical protein